MRFAVIESGTRRVAKVLETNDTTLVEINTPDDHSFVQIADDAIVSSGFVMADDGSFVVPQPPAVPDAVELATMLQTIDQEQDDHSADYLTDSTVKPLEYTAKARELDDYRTISAADLKKLVAGPSTVLRTRFPWAFAEVDDSGDTLSTVMARWATGMTGLSKLRAIAARAQTLKRAINAASPSARAGIFKDRSWPK